MRVLGRRALIACLVGATIACPIGTRTLLAVSGDQAPERLRRTLTFAERVAYQYAIEEVYWRHRIWPKENRGPKPPLDVIVSQLQIEQKVEDYLRKSQFVTDQRGSPITPGELQDEMERMASQTKQPEILRELFAALGNDPFVIAECLARPILAEWLSANASVVAGVSPASRNVFAAGTAPSTENLTRISANEADATYKLPEISGPLDCADDNWTATSTINAPLARQGHTAVWTGSEMIIWGGNNNVSGNLNTGARYDPATDSWMPTSIANAPSVRWRHSAVWTGSEMIVWGGGGNDILNTGGRYNPVGDSWTATSTANVPSGRISHSGIWTGSEMIVWGGYGCGGNCIWNTGGRYNPSNDSWMPTSTVNAPIARFKHNAQWTGSEMIIWGGSDGTNYLHTGGRYNPNNDSWTPTGLTNVPLGRFAHTAVWTGDEMIVWGGVDEFFNPTNTGGRYDPSTDSWILTTTANTPSPRADHIGVWTSSEMLVWGGGDTSGFFNTGGRYNPTSDAWTPTTTANAPSARGYSTAVWTGSEMIVWGGINDIDVLNTGGRYCAQSGATPTPTATATPTPTVTATVTPSPSATPRVTPTPRSRPTPAPRPTPRSGP
jgi:N-acetylneuraminic acid mutarotase